MLALFLLAKLAVWIAILAGVGVIWLRMETRRIARMAEQAVPPPGRFVMAGGWRFHVVEEGEGAPILFVHGLGAHLFHFTQPLFPLLSGFRLVAFDRASSGYSERGPGDKAGLPEQARQIAELMGALGLARALVVGHSLGGAIALRLALDFPDKVAGLALLAPLTGPMGPLPPELRGLEIRSPLLRRFVAHTVAAPLGMRRGAKVLERVFGPQEPPEDYGTTGGGLALLRPEHFIGSSTDAMAYRADMPEIRRRLGEIGVPIGILFGTADRLLDPREQAEPLRGVVENLDVELLEGVGHMPQYAEPARVAAFIRRMAGRGFSGARGDASGQGSRSA